MQTIHNYILFPESLDDSLEIDTAKKSIDLIKGFQMTIDLADCEKGSLLYYSKSNKDNFIDNVKAFEELSKLNIGLYDFETFVNTIFNEKDIIAVNEDVSKCKVTTYNSMQGGLDEKPPLIFFEVIKRNESLNQLDKQIVLNLFNCYFSQNPIMIIIDCTISNSIVKNIEIPFVTNFVDLDNWLIENRIKRNFNENDNRHIENHPQNKIASHNKSPLIGGLGGKQNAENLLKNAIGDKRSASNSLDLMNFDTKNDAYIWYENENADNQYHAYHLVKAITHQKDDVAISRVSSRVLKILDYRKRLN